MLPLNPELIARISPNESDREYRLNFRPPMVSAKS